MARVTLPADCTMLITHSVCENLLFKMQFNMIIVSVWLLSFIIISSWCHYFYDLSSLQIWIYFQLQFRPLFVQFRILSKTWNYSSSYRYHQIKAVNHLFTHNGRNAFRAYDKNKWNSNSHWFTIKFSNLWHFVDFLRVWGNRFENNFKVLRVR